MTPARRSPSCPASRTTRCARPPRGRRVRLPRGRPVRCGAARGVRRGARVPSEPRGTRAHAVPDRAGRELHLDRLVPAERQRVPRLRPSRDRRPSRHDSGQSVRAIVREQRAAPRARVRTLGSAPVPRYRVGRRRRIPARRRPAGGASPRGRARRPHRHDARAARGRARDLEGGRQPRARGVRTAGVGALSRGRVTVLEGEALRADASV